MRSARSSLSRRMHTRRFEALEPRHLLAGDVHIVHGGNVLSITPLDDNVKFQVIGNADGSLTISPLDSETTLNQQTGSVTVDSGFEDLHVRVRASNATMVFDSVAIPDVLRINGPGRGNDIQLTGTSVGGKSDVRTFDNLQIVDSVFENDLTLMGDAAELLSLQQVDIGRNLKIGTGASNDIVKLRGVEVAADATINTNKGDDHLCISDSNFHEIYANLGDRDDRLDVSSTSAYRAILIGGSKEDVLGYDDTNNFEISWIRGFEEETDPDCDEQTLPEFTLYSNPSDPLLLSVVGDDGTKIEYFGEKDASGVAVSLQTMVITSPTGDVTTIKVDETGKPTAIYTPDGETFLFDWLTETSVLATAISADGSIQANTTINFGTPPPPATLSGTTSRQTGSLQATITPTSVTATVPTTLAAVAATSQSTVTVTQCEGMPVDDANVRILVQPDSGSSFVVPASYVGGGEYTAAIPTKDVNAGATAEDICNGVLDVLSGCFLVEPIPPAAITQICIGLGAAIDVALGGPTGEGAAIFAACEAGLLAYQAACRLNPSPDVPGAPGLLDALCDNIGSIVDRAVGESYLLTPIVTVPGQGNFTAAAQSALASGPFPNFNIEVGGTVEIVSFTTSPVDPGPFQSYVATVDIACAEPDTLVTISIVGTDGYTDSTTCTLSGDGTCTLVVPGAEAGVADRITVAIAGGPTRNIGLVF